MSYVSGFMMGAAIGKSIRQMFGGSSAAAPSGNPAVGRRGRAATLPRQAAVGDAPSFALVSTLPGRRRYRASRIAPAIAAALEERLSSLEFIKEIQVNALSGSILITFDETDCLRVDALAAWLKEHLFSEPSSAEAACAGLDESHAGRVTRSVRNTGRAFSAWINRHTAGWFDMSSLVSLLFALRGLRKVLMTYSSPSGAQMLWWALSLMRGWRTV
ncbi:HMA2 domain-containing protein [Mitsuokella jalaludinii]|uniref:HMA2 domain-containing protein n=2 Tax=Mitsuokella jalaludinii TaxID=187979 RepID=UPI0030806196